MGTDDHTPWIEGHQARIDAALGQTSESLDHHRANPSQENQKRVVGDMIRALDALDVGRQHTGLGTNH
jgi:hypothetical protein